MQVDEGRKSWNIFAIKCKARTVVGRGEKSLLYDPGSELRLGQRERKKKGEDNKRDGKKQLKE